MAGGRCRPDVRSPQRRCALVVSALRLPPAGLPPGRSAAVTFPAVFACTPPQPTVRCEWSLGARDTRRDAAAFAALSNEMTSGGVRVGALPSLATPCTARLLVGAWRALRSPCDHRVDVHAASRCCAGGVCMHIRAGRQRGGISQRGRARLAATVSACVCAACGAGSKLVCCVVVLVSRSVTPVPTCVLGGCTVPLCTASARALPVSECERTGAV